MYKITFVYRSKTYLVQVADMDTLRVLLGFLKLRSDVEDLNAYEGEVLIKPTVKA